MTEATRYTETSVLKESHGITSQKAAISMVTAVETSNLTYIFYSNWQEQM
jgi:hypothetical protein